MVIDRFEGDFAVVSKNGALYNVPIKLLPDGAKEGDVICITISPSKTEEKRQEIKKKMSKIFKSDC